MTKRNSNPDPPSERPDPLGTMANADDFGDDDLSEFEDDDDDDDDDWD